VWVCVCLCECVCAIAITVAFITRKTWWFTPSPKKQLIVAPTLTVTMIHKRCTPMYCKIFDLSLLRDQMEFMEIHFFLNICVVIV